MYKAARLDAHQRIPTAWGNGCKPLQSEFEYALNLRKSKPLAPRVRHSNCLVMVAGHRVSRFEPKKRTRELREILPGRS
jgi:hypothetical protein